MRIVGEIDETAKRYWDEFYGDSGYGEQLTKDLPKRILAALGGGRFVPIGHGAGAEGSLTIEGLHTPEKGPPARLVALRVDAEGAVRQLTAVALSYSKRSRK